MLFKDAKWNLILIAGIYIASGLALILVPKVDAVVVAYVLACFLLILGLIRTITYFAGKAELGFFRFDLLIGLCLILLGIVILIKIDNVAVIILTVLALLVAVSGILKLQHALNLLRVKAKGWLVVLILAGINLTFGILLLLNLFRGNERLYSILLGAGLAFSGLTDIFTTLMIDRNMKKNAAKPAPAPTPTVDAVPAIEVVDAVPETPAE